MSDQPTPGPHRFDGMTPEEQARFAKLQRRQHSLARLNLWSANISLVAACLPFALAGLAAIAVMAFLVWLLF